ncbi:MAG: hypothetical protein H6Q89_1475 [Myxococcaceae bacterium]|nr:hypothetical protein [Myxococcaceae bacterium]
MKNYISGALVLVAVSLSAAYAADSLQKGEMKGDTKKSDTMLKTENVVIIPSMEMKWVDQPDAQGVKIAVAEGDLKKGPHHAYLKFNAGFDMPIHHHSADTYGTLISGTMMMTVDGKEYRIQPGSYFSYTSKAKHATRCDKGADCVLFVDVRGAWDVVPEKAVKAGR